VSELLLNGTQQEPSLINIYLTYCGGKLVSSFLKLLTCLIVHVWYFDETGCKNINIVKQIVRQVRIPTYNVTSLEKREYVCMKGLNIIYCFANSYPRPCNDSIRVTAR